VLAEATNNANASKTAGEAMIVGFAVLLVTDEKM